MRACRITNDTCAHCGGPRNPRKGKTYCGRSCAMKALRATQTPERRREMARHAGLSYQPEWQARLLARVKCFAAGRDQQILLAYRYGRMAAKTWRYRARQQERQAS